MSATRAVRVVTDVAAVDKSFDYLLNESTPSVGVGDRVRVNLHGRSVRGWVWSFVTSEREMKPVVKWLGYGVPETMLPLVAWAARRWNGPVARFLIAGSPERLVTSLPSVPVARPLDAAVAAAALVLDPGVIQLGPTIDPLGLVLHAHLTATGDGSLLVLVPTDAWARRLGGRLAQRGIPVAFADQWDRARAGWPVVIGARGTAFAPVPTVRGAVVLDGDDEAYRSEATPTWHAVDVIRERCRQFDAPYWITSPVPSPTLRYGERRVIRGPDQRAAWPLIDVVDRRTLDPHDGVLSSSTLIAARRALASEEAVAVVVVLQRLGKGRLLACRKCGTLARCEVCGQAEEEVDDALVCSFDDRRREIFCRSCGATSLRKVRSGVTTLARDVAAQLSQPVTEITSASEFDVPLHRVVVGTEAVWQRVRRAGVVVFVDFDQYLLAPRERARRDALLAVAKAGRLVGAVGESRGRVILQTRRDDDDVLRALRAVDFAAISDEDDEVARELSLPPFAARAEISGEVAASYAAAVASPEVTVRAHGDRFTAHADTVDALTERLAQVERPPGRLRVAVE